MVNSILDIGQGSSVNIHSGTEIFNLLNFLIISFTILCWVIIIISSHTLRVSLSHKGDAALLAIAKQWDWAGKYKELKYGCEFLKMPSFSS